jgi:hypothetical protein
LDALGVAVNQIMTAGTAAHAIIVKMISHTAVIFSAIGYAFRIRYINFQNDVTLLNRIISHHVGFTFLLNEIIRIPG